MVIITIANSLLHPIKWNSNIISLATYAKNSWSYSRTEKQKNKVTKFEIDEPDLIEVSTIALVIATGWEVEWMPLFLSIDKEYAENNSVPVDVPDSSIHTEEETTQKLWSNMDNIILQDDKYYIETTSTQERWNGSLVVELAKNENINIITVSEYKSFTTPSTNE